MEAKILDVFPLPGAMGLVELVDYVAVANKHFIPQDVIIQAPEIVFALNGIPILTKKSISLLIAKAKAGKTTVAAWIIAQAINAKSKVLWIDTEQGLYYASRTQSWVLQIAGLTSSENLSFYDLKIHNPSERIKIIEALLQQGNYDFIVLDGIRDLVFDINSPEEATNISTSLMQWADNYNAHVLTILHQNKGNEHARGHLGAEMVNKAETVIKVSQNEANQIVVDPEFTRGKPFEPFALFRDENGIPALIDQWMPEANISRSPNKLRDPIEFPESAHLEVLHKIFKDNEGMTSGNFISGLMAAW